MTLLQRYVFVKFLKTYLLSAVGLIGIFLIVDFFERVDEFLAKDSPMTDLLAYYLFKIPHIAFFMAPQAVLLATVVTLAALARDNEITAMKACGIGITGITLPIIGGSLGIALLVLASNEYIAPEASARMNYIFFVKVRNKPTYGKIQTDKIWLISKNTSIWNIDQYDPKNSKMRGVSIFFRQGDRIIRRIDAQEGVWNGTHWEFINGYLRTFKVEGLDKTEFFERRILNMPETPADFERVRKRPEEMSMTEMYQTIQREIAEGKDVSQKWVELHHRISYPFIAIVLALLGIPLSLRSSRHGGVLFCVGINLAMGFVFSFIYAMGISLGHGGLFDPVLAAWGPNILFISLGFYLVLTLDSERILPQWKEKRPS